MNVLNDIELNIATKVDKIRVRKAKLTKDSWLSHEGWIPITRCRQLTTAW